jgi:concanavalin A-like lectin/glucanase superfamily protein
MTARDADDLIREWFQEGPSRGTEDGLERTLARLATTRQRVSREITMPAWLPAAAVVVLLLAVVLAFGAGFRVVLPGPERSPDTSAPIATATGCRLDVPVHGRDAVLVGVGFAPDADVAIEIDRASGNHIAFGAHTDRTGGFTVGFRPYDEDLGRGVVTAIAGCSASLEVEVTAADLPFPCPDPNQESTPLVDGPAYRAAVAADGPLAWWQLDDTGDVAADAAGNHPGTYIEQMEHAVLSPLSDGGSAFFHHQFPGTAIIDIDPIELTGDFTVEFWLDMCHWADGDPIVGSEESIATISIGEGELHLNNGVRDVLWTGETVIFGEWQHFVVLRSGDTLEIYRNGELDGSEPDAGWTGGFPISMLGGGIDANFLGYLDEVALYDHALTPERIAAHAHP